MNTKTITVYNFSELSDAAKQNVLNKFSDINVSHEWWDGVYEDAKQIGLSITGFDLDRGLGATGEIESSCRETADLIIKNHGEVCDTHKLAVQFLSDYDNLVAKYSDGEDLTRVTEENEYDFDNECDDLEEEFKRALLEEYAHLLQKEYDYLTSEESITEFIMANEYEFDEDGYCV